MTDQPPTPGQPTPTPPRAEAAAGLASSGGGAWAVMFPPPEGWVEAHAGLAASAGLGRAAPSGPPDGWTPVPGLDPDAAREAFAEAQRGTSSMAKDLGVLGAAREVATRWGQSELARLADGLLGLAAQLQAEAHRLAPPLGQADPSAKAFLPGQAIAIPRQAPWEAMAPAQATLGLEGESYGVRLQPHPERHPQEPPSQPADFYLTWAAQGSQIHHAKRAEALLNHLAWARPGHQRPHEEPAALLAFPLPELAPPELLAQVGAAWASDEALLETLPTLHRLLTLAAPEALAAEARLLRRAADDGGTSGPRFRGEFVRAVRNGLIASALGLAWRVYAHRLDAPTEHLPPQAEAFHLGQEDLVLRLDFLGLELALTRDGLAAALVGEVANPIVAAGPAEWTPRPFALALLAALSAHGVLRGPCERCAFPAWLVPYRAPGKAGPKPLSDRLCPTCEVVHRREQNVRASRAK